MSKKVFLAVFVFALAFSFSVAWAEPNFNPGKWEITTTTEMTGVPGMKIPPVTHTQCFEKGDIVPQSEEGSEECSVSDIRIDGNTVSWKIACSGQNGGMSGTGEATYAGDTMKGTMIMIMPGAGMKITNTLRGKRIGSCD